MDNAIDVIESGMTRIEIYQDDDPYNPRESDNLGTMVCFHNRYDLGDENHGFSSPEDLIEYIKDNQPVLLTIWAYEHGGITLKSSIYHSNPFVDPWDSGQVGVIFVTDEQIRKEYGWKYVTAKRVKQIREYLKNEVETYDDYLTGAVYGYKVFCNQCEEELDSCWGFYGYDHRKSGLLESAQGHTCDTCKVIAERLDSILEASNV